MVEVSTLPKEPVETDEPLTSELNINLPIQTYLILIIVILPESTPLNTISRLLVEDFIASITIIC